MRINGQYRLGVVALSLWVVCSGIGTLAHGTGQNSGSTSVPVWVSFSAKFIGVRANGETVRGLYERSLDGSTRNETLSPDQKTSQITIRHAGRRRVYMKSFDGVWRTAPFPGPNFIVMPLRGDFDQPGVKVESAVYEGRPALRVSRGSEIQTVLPELNYFAVVRETPSHRERYYDIVIGPTPEADFEPPTRADVEEFESVEELSVATKRSGRGGFH